MARRPHWVYADGSEPDYRFSLANERTFLAWIRTALALLAGGAALDALDFSLPDEVQRVLAGVLVVGGLSCAVLAWFRWAASERALRRDEPLPSVSWAAFLPVTVAGVAVVGIVASFWS